jgi:hypothetical protein
MNFSDSGQLLLTWCFFVVDVVLFALGTIAFLSGSLFALAGRRAARVPWDDTTQREKLKLKRKVKI